MKLAIKNSKGMSTILIVMAISMIILTTLGSAQMYIESRARHHARIRVAYKYTFIMEDAAKMLVNGRLAQQAGACPGGTVARTLHGPGAPPDVCLGNVLTGPVGNQTSPRCILDSVGRAACICLGGFDNYACSLKTNAFMEKNLLQSKKEQTFVAELKSQLQNQNHAMQDFLATGIEKLFQIPSERKSSIYESLFGEKAVAATMAITMRGVDVGPFEATVPAPVTPPFDPQNYAPSTIAFQARTTFDCNANECYVLRLCINSDAEPLIVPVVDPVGGGPGFLCMEQRIARLTGETQF